MNDILSLYKYADDNGIDVDWRIMKRAVSLSLPLPGGTYAISIDTSKVKTTSEHIVDLAHELGHCKTGAFYNRYTPFDVQRKHENRADTWAIKKLVPKDKLEMAVQAGHTEIWELAEYFDVTEEFMQKAVYYYRYGHLPV